MTTQKKLTGIRLREDLIDELKLEAAIRNRSLTNYVETILLDRQPPDRIERASGMPDRIRKQFRFGVVTAHLARGRVLMEVDGDLYFWDPASTCAGAGLVEHGGNFLQGTEHRSAARSSGDWVRFPHVEHGHVVTTRCLSHLANGYPSLDVVISAFKHGGDGWERPNPEDGHNDEWIGYPAQD